MAIINIRGILVEMLLDIAPDIYGMYVTTYRKGIKQLMNQTMDSIYVTMVESLIYYCRFCKTLKLKNSILIHMVPVLPIDW